MIGPPKLEVFANNKSSQVEECAQNKKRNGSNSIRYRVEVVTRENTRA